MNPNTKDLQFLNDNINKYVWGNLKYNKGIKVKDRKHALKLFKEQQDYFRKGKLLIFEDTPF